MSDSFKLIQDKDYRGVVVQERGENGIIFCKDIPQFITYRCFREKSLKLGQTAMFKCKRLEFGQLTAFGAWQCSNVYEEGVTRDYFRPIVSAIIIQENPSTLPLPFTKVGLSEEFGRILIPRAHDFRMENNQRVIVQIQYCDFFIDGIVWIAIGWKYKPNSQIRLFEPNLIFSEQSFSSYLNRKKPRITESLNQQPNLRNAQNAHGSNSNLSQGSSTKQKKKIAYRPECMLYFDPIEPHRLSAKFYTSRDKHYLLVIKIKEAYKIGIIFPFATAYGIIPKTTSDPEQKAKVGAFLEVSINQITSPNSPFQFVVQHIHEKTDYRVSVTDYEKDRFVFQVGLIDTYLDLRSVYPIGKEVKEKIIKSEYWGPILFDRKSLDQLVEFEEQGFKFVVQHLLNHPSKAAWIAVPYTFRPKGKPTSSSTLNDPNVTPTNSNGSGKHNDSNDFSMNNFQ